MLVVLVDLLNACTTGYVSSDTTCCVAIVGTIDIELIILSRLYIYIKFTRFLTSQPSFNVGDKTKPMRALARKSMFQSLN